MKVVTSVVNNPLFIQIQFHTLRRYLKNDYEFIVFNDAKDFPDFTNGGNINIKKEIKDICDKLNIKCINIPSKNHEQNKDYAIRCADSMNYILQFQLENPDQYLVIDSDMFLVSDFDISKYEGRDCAIVLQERNLNDIEKIIYFWNGIYYFDIFRMKDKNLLNWNLHLGITDVGGMMSEWLCKMIPKSKIPSTDTIRWNKTSSFSIDNIYFIRHLWSCTWNEKDLPDKLTKDKDLLNFFTSDPRNVNNNFFCEIYDEAFLHYRAGGNWNGEGLDFHILQANKLKEVLC